MNWITNIVRPKLRALVNKTDVPDNLWTKCPHCEQMLYHREIETNLHVCPRCDHHLRIQAVRRLQMLFDDGLYEVIEFPKVLIDPLRFRDRKRYIDRLREAQANADLQDAIVVAHGRLGAVPVVMAVLDFDFMGGSMGMAVGEAILTAARVAVRQQAPFIAISSSGGARMQEGILSLMQLPRTVIAIEEVKDAGLPYIAILADPTTGGVSASFAMLGDIAIAEPGAVIGFAGARVIEETIRQALPEGFQRSEFLRDHGMVDMVVHRRDLRDTLIRILGLLRSPTPGARLSGRHQTSGSGASLGRRQT
jgi:acetyl-CoA carboxylase carboxyl transferase subunit beta